MVKKTLSGMSEDPIFCQQPTVEDNMWSIVLMQNPKVCSPTFFLKMPCNNMHKVFASAPIKEFAIVLQSHNAPKMALNLGLPCIANLRMLVCFWCAFLIMKHLMDIKTSCIEEFAPTPKKFHKEWKRFFPKQCIVKVNLHCTIYFGEGVPLQRQLASFENGNGLDLQVVVHGIVSLDVYWHTRKMQGMICWNGRCNHHHGMFHFPLQPHNATLLHLPNFVE